MNSEWPISSSSAIPAGKAPNVRWNRPLFSSRSWLHFWTRLALLGVLSIGSYYVISRFFVQSVRVVGSSMSPTLHDSDCYLLNRWFYHLHAPERTDIVVLQDPADHGFSVKRIVGVAGDSVWLKKGEVFINGKKLDEPYLQPGTATFPSVALDEQRFKCKKDEYFVLGDNRNNSVDSRLYGPVPRRNILGFVVK